MSASIATCLCILFILWLFVKDAKLQNKSSAALWVPLIWALIMGSKPISLWVGYGREITLHGALPEDPLIDKATFFVLIAVGLIILSSRRADWRRIFANNKWVFAYFAYIGISVLWSGDPFVAFKRWFKDFGNIVMVLVVLSEAHPVESFRRLLARCTYVLIPVSVLVIKYYPDISRGYNIWSFEPFFVGITTDKNMFGMTLSVCVLTLLWMLLALWDAKAWVKDKTRLVQYLLLLAMTAWLLPISHSSTALTCAVLGASLLFGVRVPTIRRHVRRLGLYIVVTTLLILILQAFVGLGDVFVQMFVQLVGRDPTFHGRTDIWSVLLKENINPLFGEGYSSFWSSERMQRISETYYYTLNEAHNGYLETYLNTGLVGLFLLIGTLVSAWRRNKWAAIRQVPLGDFRLACLFVVMSFGMTEAVFNRLNLLWFVCLLVIFEYSRRVDFHSELEQARYRGIRRRVVTIPDFPQRTPATRDCA
jgi:exopolysaccharide production protein ExoQ